MQRFNLSNTLAGAPFPALLLAAAGMLAACASEFTSCEDTQTCKPEPGSGAGGESGDEAVGGAGTDPGNGGSGNDGNGGNEDPEGEPCEEDGATECIPGRRESVLVCANGSWSVESCEAGMACASASGACAPFAEGCEERAPGEAFCDGTVRRQCSVDRTEVTEETCEATCAEGDCLAPGCGDGLVQSGEACDDGNTEKGDGCSRCRWEPVDVKALPFGACAIFADGRMKCWGENDSGQLGLGDTSSRGTHPTHMGADLPYLSLEKVTDVAGAFGTTCAIADEKLWCWGSNAYGQLAGGSTGPNQTRPKEVPFSSERRFRKIAAGLDFFCALPVSLSEKPLCWGNSRDGQTGAAWQSEEEPKQNVRIIGDEPGEIERNPGPVVLAATSLALSEETGCAIASPSLRCWGSNNWGLLGISSVASYGLYDTDTGPPPAIDLGPGFLPETIAAGGSHYCVTSTEGAVKCWGEYVFGMLPSPRDQLKGWDAELKTNTVDVGGTVATLTISGGYTFQGGGTFTCASLRDGTVKCWGQHYRGSLARPELDEYSIIGDDLDEMGAALPSIELGGGVRSITAGYEHVCVQLITSEIKCWGSNVNSQLGLGLPSEGSTTSIGDEHGEMEALEPVRLD